MKVKRPKGVGKKFRPLTNANGKMLKVKTPKGADGVERGNKRRLGFERRYREESFRFRDFRIHPARIPLQTARCLTRGQQRRLGMNQYWRLLHCWDHCV